jgi:hypothetical protein
MNGVKRTKRRREWLSRALQHRSRQRNPLAASQCARKGRKATFDFCVSEPGM